MELKFDTNDIMMGDTVNLYCESYDYIFRGKYFIKQLVNLLNGEIVYYLSTDHTPNLNFLNSTWSQDKLSTIKMCLTEKTLKIWN